MEEVDRIVSRALAQSGCEIPDDVVSVQQFSTELIVEAVVRCLRIIDPSLGNGLSHQLPPGMSARFRIGMSLAQACQDLGYEGEIGYQTFLYSNEPEIRRLLMFLVEKLPRDSIDSANQPAGKSVLQRSIASKIKQQLAIPWVPASLRTPSLLRVQSSRLMQKFHSQPLSLPENYTTEKKIPEEVKEYYDRYLLPVTAQPSRHSFVAASLLEQAVADLSAVQEWESEWNSQGLVSRLSPEEAEQIVCELEAAGTTLSSARESEEDIQAQQEQEVRSFQQQLDELNGRFEQVTEDMKHLMVSISQVGEEVRLAELTADKKEELIKVKRRTLELLPDAENNLVKLQGVIESSAQRIVNLASQWEKHRVPLIEEHRRLKEVVDNRELESSRKLVEIKTVHEKIRQSADEAKKKEGMYKQLLTEYESLPKEVARSAYTHRILEIVGNIKKQKEEIIKILCDTKDLQKEINGLTGKLERTFVVTDELVFKDAKRDEAVRKAYKYLAALHENCSHLIQTIEDTGTIMREVRDLDEQ
uniref:coiled-coil domain-containing protein 22 n=1 Tax=Pristiophorus japonicus TaxID=55135 RepID=UPI00398E5BBC